jgi:hexosaminidase
MPGHAQAALTAYPEFACTEGPFEVAMTWGVFEDIYCPYDETFEFLETVLAEVIELFPGEYVHIGGDEAPKTRWEESLFVRDLMQREGMTDVDRVQSYFIRRIERFLNDNGKRMIGWDEILEGGLAPNATVMSWRGTLGGIEASRMGHDVVMTPYSNLYFDYYQSEDQANEPFAIGGFLPLDSVYAYEPVPQQMRAEDAAHIIGAQANVWTEYMKTPEQIEYMIFPRMFALAELAWSPIEAKDFADFRQRIEWHVARLDALDVNYRPLDPIN